MCDCWPDLCPLRPCRSLEKAKLFFGEDAVSGHDKDEENYRWGLAGNSS